jgi:hypothetical protein
MEWLIAFSIVMPFFLLFMSIPSMVSIYRLGIKDYFRNIKLLIGLYKKLGLCYELTENKLTNFVYSTGHKVTKNYETTDYYFPIYINDNHVFIVHKMYKGLKGHTGFYDLRINDARFDGKDWETDLMEIKTTTCIFSQLLNDRFQKKMNRLIEDKIILDDIGNLNDLINSEIKSIRRENKLNKLVNG